MEKSAIAANGSCVKVIILNIIFSQHLKSEIGSLEPLNPESGRVKFQDIFTDNHFDIKPAEIPAA